MTRDAARDDQRVSSVSWPAFGAAWEGAAIAGHTNTVPDVIGPVDGSAKLTILTEGNHFPALLSLLFGDFVREAQALEAKDVLVITLPQVLLLEALTTGGLRLGNALLPLDRERVYPDLIMGSRAALSKLWKAGIVEAHATIFAKHRGAGLLLRRDTGAAINSVQDLSGSSIRVVLATPNEAGARSQYERTLSSVLGASEAASVLEYECTFEGRLGIQHRDVPFALLTDQADVGIIFAHLASYWADVFPEQFRYVHIPEAAQFGESIAVASVLGKAAQTPAETFRRFFLERAGSHYPSYGFRAAAEFDYGAPVSLEVTPETY